MRVPFLLLATVLWGALAAPASAFTLLTLDKEATFYSDPSRASGIAEIRVGRDRALAERRDPRCPATSRIRISSYYQNRFVGNPEMELPCERWSKGAEGYVYRDPTGAAAGIRTIRYGRDGLTIRAASPGHIPVVGPVGFVHVRFSVGETRYFVRFHNFSRNDPRAVVSPRPSRAAALGEAAFWDTLLGDAHRASESLRLLRQASAANPRDGRSLFLAGMMHLYRYEIVVPDPRFVSTAGKREILASTVAFDRAVPLLWDGVVGDSRAGGFAAAATYKKGIAFGDPNEVARGIDAMNRATDDNPLFNGFIPFGAGPIAAPDSPAYATILHLLDDVFPTVFGECGSNAEICFNDGLAPHNLEGTLLLFGDLYAKAGRVEDAETSYSTAAAAGENSGWSPAFIARARTLAATAAERAALYNDEDPRNDPPFTDLGGVGNCAYCHNR